MKTELKWAVIFNLAILLWMLMERLSGLHGRYLEYHYYITNVFFIPAIWLIVLALKAKKKVDYAGTMTYRQGVISGLVLTGFIAAMSPISQWITSYVISPDYFTNVIPLSVELGYFDSIPTAEAHFNFKNYVLGGLISWIVLGLVTTSIAMIFIRSPKSEESSSKIKME